MRVNTSLERTRGGYSAKPKPPQSRRSAQPLGMALASTIVAALAAAIVINVILLFSGGFCTASSVIITHPIDALLSIPWPNERRFGPSCNCPSTLFLRRLAKHLEHLVALVGTDLHSSNGRGICRSSPRWSSFLSRGGMAAAIGVAIPLTIELNRMLATGQFNHTLTFSWTFTILVFTITAAALGLIGATIAKCHA